MAEYLLIANKRKGHFDDLYEVHSFKADSDEKAEKNGLERLDALRNLPRSGVDHLCNFRVVKVVKTLL